MKIEKDTKQDNTWLIKEDGEAIGGFTVNNGIFEIWSLRGKMLFDRYDEQSGVIDL